MISALTKYVIYDTNELSKLSFEIGLPGGVFVKKFFSVIVILAIFAITAPASAAEFFSAADPSTAKVIAVAGVTVDESMAVLSGTAYDVVLRLPASVRVYQVMGLVILASQESISIGDVLNRSGSFAVVKTDGLEIDWQRGRDCYESDYLGGVVTCVFDTDTALGSLNGDFEIRMPAWWLFGSTDPTKFFDKMFDELAPSKG